VSLGFVPGAGGTQRLPRLVGLEPALDVIVRGRRLDAREALRIRAVDGVVAREDLRERAVAFAARLGGVDPRRTRELPLGEAAPDVFERTRAELAREARGRRAPAAALELVKTTRTLPFAEGLRRERKVFLDMVRGPEARALRHVFFAEREARKVRWCSRTRGFPCACSTRTPPPSPAAWPG
jgi:3-hydroxyacyl-CoA dehydrogenase